MGHKPCILLDIILYAMINMADVAAQTFQREKEVYVLVNKVFDVAMLRSRDASVDFHPPLENFRSFVIRCTEDYRMEIVHTYSALLFKIIKLVRGFWISLPSSTRSLYDTLFFNLLKMQRQMTSEATDEFERFMPGISVFGMENINASEKPLYHRDASCGPKSLTTSEYDDTRRCGPQHSLSQRDANKARILKCYVERLVYDKIYEKHNLRFPGKLEYQGAQDANHWRRLEKTREDFESCFPFTKLILDVDFDERDIPFCLTIRIVEDNKERNSLTETIETYVKSVGNKEIYGLIVHCRKEVNDNATKKSFYKSQHFKTGQMPWQDCHGLQSPEKLKFDDAMNQWIVADTPTSLKEYHAFGGGTGKLVVRQRDVSRSGCTLQ